MEGRSDHTSDIKNVLCEIKNNNWKFRFKKKNTVCKHQLEMIEKFSSHIIKEDEQIIWAQIPFFWSMNMSLNSIFSFTNNLF